MNKTYSRKIKETCFLDLWHWFMLIKSHMNPLIYYLDSCSLNHIWIPWFMLLYLTQIDPLPLLSSFDLACLVHYNGYYAVIGISITKNKKNCNIIIITIHLFDDNKWIEPWICIIYFTTTWLIYEYCLLNEY